MIIHRLKTSDKTFQIRILFCPCRIFAIFVFLIKVTRRLFFLTFWYQTILLYFRPVLFPHRNWTFQFSLLLSSTFWHIEETVNSIKHISNQLAFVLVTSESNLVCQRLWRCDLSWQDWNTGRLVKDICSPDEVVRCLGKRELYVLSKIRIKDDGDSP